MTQDKKTSQSTQSFKASQSQISKSKSIPEGFPKGPSSTRKRPNQIQASQNSRWEPISKQPPATLNPPVVISKPPRVQSKLPPVKGKEKDKENIINKSYSQPKISSVSNSRSNSHRTSKSLTQNKQRQAHDDENNVNAAANEVPRSRSTSSSTLQANSQQSKPNAGENGTSNIDITISKSEQTILKELNVAARRYFLAYLSNLMVDEPLRAVLPGMKVTHPAYKQYRMKIMGNYKQWKANVLRDALKWIDRFISTADDQRSTDLAEIRNFKELKTEVTASYHESWLESVFRFGVEAVKFEEINDQGLRFLKCEWMSMKALMDDNLIKQTHSYS